MKKLEDEINDAYKKGLKDGGEVVLKRLQDMGLLEDDVFDEMMRIIEGYK